MTDTTGTARGKWDWPLGPVRTLLIVTLVLSALFLLVPAFDVWFSSRFYDSEIGFPAALVPAFVWLRWLSNALVWAIGAGLIVSVLAKLAMPEWRSIIPVRATVLLGTTLALGPGLIVNGILKSMWGRPRPVEVTDFGGDFPFVPVWRISGYCDHNCSFVSGEASTAIWLVALVLVVPASWRRPVATTTLSLAVLFSLNRIAFGGHFLSDVLLSWSLTLLLIAAVHHRLYVEPLRGLDEATLDGGLTRTGRALRSPFRRRRSPVANVAAAPPPGDAPPPA